MQIEKYTNKQLNQVHNELRNVLKSVKKVNGGFYKTKNAQSGARYIQEAFKKLVGWGFAAGYELDLIDRKELIKSKKREKEPFEFFDLSRPHLKTRLQSEIDSLEKIRGRFITYSERGGVTYKTLEGKHVARWASGLMYEIERGPVFDLEGNFVA